MAKITIQKSKDDKLVPLWDGFQLHSLYQPVKEGQNQAEKFIDSVTDFSKPLLVFGLGFGYHILPLAEKFEKIYIIETCNDLITLAKEQDFLKQLFIKSVIINNEEDAVKIKNNNNVKDFNIFILRAELRFQERAFEKIKEILISEDVEFKPALNQLRILVNSPVYGGSYTTAKYIENALEYLNANVRFTDNSDADSLLQKYLLNTSANSTLIEKLTELLSDSLWLDVLDFKPHIVIFPAQSPFTNNLIKALKKAGIVTVYWFVEDFRRFSYWKDVCNSFDYFFMIQKGDFEKLLEQRCSSIWGWFPMAAEKSIHKPLNLEPSDLNFYGSDVSFMGAAYPNRQNFFQNLNQKLKNQSSYSLKLWGTGWYNEQTQDINIPLKNNRISIEETVKIFNASKININLHSSMNNEMFDTFGDFINPRTFEIAACGGFQLTDNRPAVKELFEEDKEIVLFSSLEEANDKIIFYLKNDYLRNKIATASREKVLKFHTYDVRLINMLEAVITNSPSLRSNIYKENEKINKFLMHISDKDLSDFLNRIEPGLRFSYERLFKELNNSKGSLKNYEAFLMLIDSFVTGE